MRSPRCGDNSGAATRTVTSDARMRTEPFGVENSIF